MASGLKPQELPTEQNAGRVSRSNTQQEKLVGLDLRIRKPTSSEKQENPEQSWKDQKQLRHLGPECNYATYPVAKVYSSGPAVRDVSVVPKDSSSSPGKPGNASSAGSAAPGGEHHGDAHPAYATFPPMNPSVYGWTKTFARAAGVTRASDLASSLLRLSSLTSSSSSALTSGSSSESPSYPSTVSPELSVYTPASSGESWSFVTQREPRGDLFSGSLTTANAHLPSPAMAATLPGGQGGMDQASSGRLAAPCGLDLGGGHGPQQLPSFPDFMMQRYLSEASRAFQTYPPQPQPPPSLPPSSQQHPPHTGCGPFCRPGPPPMPHLPPLPLFALPPDMKGHPVFYSPLGRFLFETMTNAGDSLEQQDCGGPNLSAFRSRLISFTSATNGVDSWRALTELVKLQSPSFGARPAPVDLQTQPQPQAFLPPAMTAPSEYSSSAGSVGSQQEEGSGQGSFGTSQSQSSHSGDPPSSASIDRSQSQPTQQPSVDRQRNLPAEQAAVMGAHAPPGRLFGDPHCAPLSTLTAGSRSISHTGSGPQSRGSWPQDQGSRSQNRGSAGSQGQVPGSQGEGSRSQGQESESKSQASGSQDRASGSPSQGSQGPGEFPFVPLQPGSSEEMAADFMLFCMAVQSALTPPVGSSSSSSSAPSGSAMPPYGNFPFSPDFDPSWFHFLPGFPR